MSEPRSGEADRGKSAGLKARQLTSIDAQFLAVEDSRNFAHVSGLVILDPSTAPGGAVTLSDAIKLVEERLYLLPPFRWKLQEVPLNLDIPYWINDPDFDLEFHIRELALPAPGSDAQLSAQVERLVARPLDRSRPLWEMYLIQGLSGGRLAMLTKMHHAVIDGVSGAEMMGILLDLSPEGGDLPPRPDPERPDRLMSPLELVVKGIRNVPERTLGSLRGLPTILPNLVDLPPLRETPGLGLISRVADRIHFSASGGRDGQILERPSAKAPKSLLNGPVSAHRKFSFGSLSLDTVKKVKNAYGTTVNDVVVAISTAALRDFLVSRAELPDDPLVAMIPLSIRKQDETGTFGNRVSAMVVPIPTDEPDPVERLRVSHDELARSKDYYGALPADMLTDVMNFIPPALFARTARVTTALAAGSRFQPPFNVTISNVPGPAVPLYVAGARVEDHYPVSVITDGMLLNITVLSYRDRLEFGVVGDRELAPNFDSIIESMRRDLDSLERAAAGLEAAPERAG